MSDFTLFLGALPLDLGASHSERGLFCHPVRAKGVEINYEVGYEEAVVAILALVLSREQNLTQEQRQFLQGLDLGYLSSEANFSEEEAAYLKGKIYAAKSPAIFVGKDLALHKNAVNIYNILALLEKSGLSLQYAQEPALKRSAPLLPECADELFSLYLLSSSGKNELLASEQFIRSKNLSAGGKVTFTLGSQRFSARISKAEISGTIAVLQLESKSKDLAAAYPFFNPVFTKEES